MSSDAHRRAFHDRPAEDAGAGGLADVPAKGLRQPFFTKRLYEHLHLHCGFIAHYSIHGFYSTYFTSGPEMERFFEQFCSYTSEGLGAGGDYHGLNTAMRDAYERHGAKIAKLIEENVERRLAVLEAAILKARGDRGFAKGLLGRLRF